MLFLHHWKIRTKLLLMLLLPVMGLLFFAGYAINEKRVQAQEMARIEGYTRLAVKISSLVHELQKERGMTSGFIGSKGAQFAADLPKQRAATDERIEELRAFLQEGRVDLGPLSAAMEKGLSRFDQLAATRAGASSFSLQLGDVIGYYTGTIASLFDVVSGLVEMTPDGDTARRITAYVNFLQGKERAGIERAVLSGTFGADQFAPGMFKRFSALVAAQETYASVFLTLATPEQKAFYQEKMQDPVVKETERIRSIAFDKAASGGFGIEASYWFAQQTAKINLLKTVEDRLAEELITATTERGELRQAELYTYSMVTLAGVAATFLFAFVLIRGITAPLHSTLAALDDIAAGEGDLTRRLEVRGSDEVAGLADAFNRFASKIQQMLLAIESGAVSIHQSTTEIAAGNLDLSQRTEEQASSLEETASSMEQMTATVKQNADNARQANQLALDARERAERGGAVVTQAVSAMGEISSASRKIAEIISVIDEIAFQTNLLALNASVEAARAGEQGRGFAVVAGEVRALAQRSASAAREIKGLIQDSEAKVSHGAELVDQSGSTLLEIVAAIKRVADLVGEISSASQEQSAGIVQVNKAVTQMDEVTQQNAALVEEAAAASHSMEEQTRSLLDLIGTFKLGEQSTMGQAVLRGTRSDSVARQPPPARSAQVAAGRGPRNNRLAGGEPAPLDMKKTSARPRAGDAEDGEWREF